MVQYVFIKNSTNITAYITGLSVTINLNSMRETFTTRSTKETRSLELQSKVSFWLRWITVEKVLRER